MIQGMGEYKSPLLSLRIPEHVRVTRFTLERICGIVSQDHDLQEMYLDSFVTIAGLKDDQLQHAIEKLDIISEKYNVRFILSISKDEHNLPECAKAKVIVSL